MYAIMVCSLGLFVSVCVFVCIHKDVMSSL